MVVQFRHGKLPSLPGKRDQVDKVCAFFSGTDRAILRLLNHDSAYAFRKRNARYDQPARDLHQRSSKRAELGIGRIKLPAPAVYQVGIAAKKR